MQNISLHHMVFFSNKEVLNWMEENTSIFHWNPFSWYIHSKIMPQLFAHTGAHCTMRSLHSVLNRWIPIVEMPSGHPIAFVHPSIIFFPILCLQIFWKRKSLQRSFQNSWAEDAAKSRTHVTQIVSIPTAQALPTHHSLSRTQVIFGRRVNGRQSLIPVWQFSCKTPVEPLSISSNALLAAELKLWVALMHIFANGNNQLTILSAERCRK